MRLTRLLLALALLSAAAHAHAGHDHDHHGHHHGHDDTHHAHHAVKKPTAAEHRRPPPVDHTGHDHDRLPPHAHEHEHEHGHDHGDHRALKAGGHDHGHDHDHDHGTHAHAHDHDHGHDHGHAHGKKTPAPASAAAKRKSADFERFSLRVWLEALFATALVGAAPVVVLLFVPLGIGNQEAQKPLLRVFLSFAAGGLLGDALLHLLPHSIPHGHDHGHDDHDHGHEDHDHGHSHSLEDLSVWLWTIAGMMTFLMLEKFVRAQTGGHGHSHSGGGGHGHSHDVTTSSSSRKVEDESSAARKRKTTAGKDSADGNHHHHADDDDDGKKRHQPQHQQIAAAGYLNLAADFAHNFTDGLAIGATFLRGSGWTTTVAMLLHELPHEIGDFAILIQSGFTRREAMLTQLLTAIGAMVGTVIGLLMEGAGESNSAWISPFTAGGFVYIACASVMPELLEDCSLWQSLKEAAAMGVGVGLMVLIALNE